MNLFKTIFVAFGVLLATATFSNASIKSEMLDPVIKINDNCSAISIQLNGEDYLLTAAHCTSQMKEGFISVITRNEEQKILREERILFDTMRIDSHKDLALLKVRDSLFKVPYAKVADKLVAEEGSDVWTVGYPLARTRVITEGLFNQIETEQFNNYGVKTMFRASPGIDGGNSGGALFQKNGDTYELIGVTSMKYRSNDFMGLYVPLNDIRVFLRLDVIPVKSTQIDQR